MTFVVNDPSNIRLIKALGGGSIYDGGVYPITFSRFIAGTDPVSVQAHMRFDPQAGVDVATSLILEYPDGVTATYVLQFRGPRRFSCPHHWRPGPTWLCPPHTIPVRRAGFDVVIGSDESRSETFQTGNAALSSRPSTFSQQCLRGEEKPPPIWADHADGTLRVVEGRLLNRPAAGRRVEL